jgi:hypothetical protein
MFSDCADLSAGFPYTAGDPAFTSAQPGRRHNRRCADVGTTPIRGHRPHVRLKVAVVLRDDDSCAQRFQAMAVPAMWVLNGRNGERIR